MKEKKVIKNAAWIIGSKIVQSVLNLIISIFTARYLGPSNFGLINYASSIAAFAIPIMNLGLNSIMVQELIERPTEEGEILGTSILFNFISAILCMLGIFSFLMVANFGETETIIVCMLYSIVLIVKVLDVIGYWFQAHLQSKYTSIVSLVAYFIFSGYKIYLLVASKDVRWFAVANALDYLIINILLYIIYKRLKGQILKPSVKTFKRLFSKSKYYIISELMIAVFAQTDRIMLNLMINEEATGYYSAAVMCAGMTGFVFSAILDSFRPMIFESKLNNEEDFKKNMCRLYSVIIYLSILQSLVISIFARLIIYILYGESFLPSVDPLRVIAWYTIFSYLGAVRNIWLLAEGKQKLIWRIDCSGAAFNIVLNLILIPFMGPLGAAIASLLTQIFTNIFVVWFIKDTRVNIKYMLIGLSPKTMISMVKSIKHTLKND